MDGISSLLRGIAALLWPSLIIAGAYFFRAHIRLLMDTVRQQLASGASIRWREVEFRGVELLSFESRHGDGYIPTPADKPLFEKRHENYKKTKNLFLVHRVRPTGQLHDQTQFPTYDISIYLIPHKNYGQLNDVREVEYYVGQYFGAQRGEYGTKYSVRNGNEGFAVRLNAYGPTLCEARIVFHDGSEATVSRYLDFEGTGYRFDPAVDTAVSAPGG